MRKVCKRLLLVIAVIIAVIAVCIGSFLIFINVKYRHVDKDIRLMGWVYDAFSTYETADELKQFSLSQPPAEIPEDEDLAIEEIVIQSSAGNDLSLIVYRSKNTKPDATALYWTHGGGYAQGSAKTEMNSVKQFVMNTNTVVISPDYRLSVVAPYPAAFNDCWDGLVWTKEHATELGINANQIFLGGGSAGGGLVTALSLKARDTGEVAIAFQMPISPMINDRMDTESMKGNTEFLWDEAKSKAGWELYLGELYGTDDVPTYAAAMRETDFTNLPPTYSYVGTLDPFYDDTINYVTAIKEAGGTADYDIYEGAYHGFDIVPSAEITKRANAKLLEEYQYAVEYYFAEQK